MKLTCLLATALLLIGCHSSKSNDNDSETEEDTSTSTQAPSTDSNLSDSDTVTSDSDPDSGSETNTDPQAATCYPEDAAAGETACFTWATESGPCVDKKTTCTDNPACLDFLACYDASWGVEDYLTAQQVCNETYAAGADNYWSYMKCVYCQACNTACAEDAGPICF